MKKIYITLLLVVFCLALIGAARQPSIMKYHEQGQSDETGPYNLMAQVVEDNDVMLFWDNPEFINQPMSFRVYCNNNMVQNISGNNVTDCYLENVCGGCHQFYVTAYYDTGCESVPSNIVEVTITSIESATSTIAPPSLYISPNPAHSDVRIVLSGTKQSESSTITIFNVRGQLIRQFSIKGNSGGVWDGKDAQGKRVSEGIYYLKASTSQGNLTQKLIIIR